MNAWLDAARDDLALLTTELPTGPYPYAGLPWFNAPFGRDGIITALECLWLRPDIARGVLAYLGSTQSDQMAPERSGHRQPKSWSRTALTPGSVRCGSWGGGR